jgi:hypothetical protein
MLILGCSRHPEKPLVSELISSRVLLYLIVAVAALIVILLSVHHPRSKRRREEDFRKRLIDGQTNWKSDREGNPYNCMYIIDDIPWKPTSPDDYTPQSIQPFDLTNTLSTSRYWKDKEMAKGRNFLLGERSPSASSQEELSGFFLFPSYPIRQTTSALEVVDTTLKSGEDTVSPISTPGASDAESETNEIFEDDADLSHTQEKRSEDDGD